MLSLIRRYRFIIAFMLVAVFSISFLAKDVHEILVKHQYIPCSDHADNSFKHFHNTEHSIDNCLICNFVMAPVLGTIYEITKIDEQSYYCNYNPYHPVVLFNSTLFAYPLRGPPSLI